MNPSEDQIDSHVCSGHAVFEPWCIDCCRGRAQEWQHFCAERESDEYPTLLWDYAYLRTSSHGIDSDEQQDEELAIPKANTVVDPRAMMVHVKNTPIA